jgi:predicted GH43/DUF377 family glycosyl hydrolase
VALAFTKDFHHFERYGLILPPEDKDAALLPHRIGDYWAMIHRPVSAPRAQMSAICRGMKEPFGYGDELMLCLDDVRRIEIVI